MTRTQTPAHKTQNLSRPTLSSVQLGTELLSFLWALLGSSGEGPLSQNSQYHKPGGERISESKRATPIRTHFQTPGLTIRREVVFWPTTHHRVGL